MATRTGRGRHAFFQFLSGRIGLRLPETAADIIKNTFKGLLQHTHTITPVIGHTKLFALCAVENNIHCLPGQFLHRCCQREMVLLRQGFKVHSEDGIRPGTAPTGGLDSTIKNRFCFIGNDQVLIRLQAETKAGTLRASTCRIVEREHSGF